MKIEDDNLSGAAVITKRALKYLYDAADEEFTSKEEFLSFIKEKCSQFSESQKSMVSLHNEFSLVLRSAEKGKTLEEGRHHLKHSIEERFQVLKKAEITIIKNGISLIAEGTTVLTHSRSSTVEKILKAACQKTSFNLIVTESRPNYEGRLLAEALAEHGIAVTLVVDMCASFFSPDLVLVGADSVTPDFVVNKIGTKFLASCFPTYVACSVSKFTSRDVSIEEKNPEEVSALKHENLEVKNYYFDRTPLDLVKGFITEYGILTPEKVKSSLF